MKKRHLSLLILFTMVVVSGLNSTKTRAQTIKGEKKLNEGQGYYYDLDGDGKKEKIKYKYTYEKSLNKIIGRLDLYINKKKVYSKKQSNEFSARYSIIDFDKKDKKLDLFCISSGDSVTLNYALFQQYTDGHIKTLKTISYKNLNHGYACLFRIRGLTKIKHNGRFSICADTPIDLWSIGSYYCYIPFELKNGKLTNIDTHTYELTKESRKYTYIANRTIPLYQKSDTSSSVIKNINHGDKIKVLKIKVGSQYKAYNETDGYAYVKDGKGKKGWIYIPKNSKDAFGMFQEYPAWG